MIMTLFLVCLNAIVICGGFIGAIVCLITAINTVIHALQARSNKTIYNEEKPQHSFANVVKAGTCVAAMTLLIGCAVHFTKLPIFPEAKERQRLVHEMKAIQSEMLKTEISEDLYDRVVKYNDDNEKYGAQHPGCEVGVTFDEDEFNSFDIKCRVKNAYADYKIFMNGVEVSQDKITLSDYRNKKVRVDDEKQEIYIAANCKTSDEMMLKFANDSSKGV